MSQVATSPVTPTRLSGTAFTVSCDAAESALSTGASGVELHLALPHLSGPGSHFLAAGEAEEKDGVQLFTSPGQVAGVVVIPCEHNLRSAVRDAYARILNATQGLHLWRMWNTVPDINRTREGLENYRAFNAGRFDAVTAHLGQGFSAELPAASAVGSGGNTAAVYFLAGERAGRHFENPNQASSWEYPSEYGNPPPAFARGTTVAAAAQHFLSGTAGIRGHATIGRTLEEQFAVMVDNIRTMQQRMQTPDTAAGEWRCFLRHESQLAQAQALFAAAFPHAVECAQWLRADICRADLLVEIEASFSVYL